MNSECQSYRLAAAAAAPSTNEDKGLEAIPKDDDPEGLKLIGVSDPLEQAAKLLAPLSTLAANNIDIWITIYDVAVRRSGYNQFITEQFLTDHQSTYPGKLLQAVKALNRAHTLDADHPELHIRLVALQKTGIDSSLSVFFRHLPGQNLSLVASPKPSGTYRIPCHRIPSKAHP